MEECEATLREMREEAGLRPDGFTAAVMLGVYSKVCVCLCV